MKFVKSSFRKGPKGLNAVNMILAIDKFVDTMFYPVMFLIPHVHKTIISPPVIRMNDTVSIYFASNNLLKCFCRTIRDDFSVNLTSSKAVLIWIPKYANVFCTYYLLT